jgi:hypothetical protein
MRGSVVTAIAPIIIGLFMFAGLALGEHLRALDWYDRLSRALLAAAIVCFGAAQLAPADASPRNVLGVLGVLLHWEWECSWR